MERVQRAAFPVILVYLWTMMILLGAMVLETFMVYPNIFHDPPRSLELAMEFMAVRGPDDFFPPLGFLSWVAGAGSRGSQLAHPAGSMVDPAQRNHDRRRWPGLDAFPLAAQRDHVRGRHRGPLCGGPATDRAGLPDPALVAAGVQCRERGVRLRRLRHVRPAAASRSAVRQTARPGSRSVPHDDPIAALG